ncbi:hypothetical protein [Vibrio aquimaris]|uniref:Uncharacterized protein n=1 Tax=Vibrio aquimaris TaxID=2587862 RepID=A0A5P9CNE6_9VIBR|nr:hypothetical protein [Vibrio aquimaris]QFT27809.1 hypothetical protein FIV01_15580 [Vibrio aquimaris]
MNSIQVLFNNGRPKFIVFIIFIFGILGALWFDGLNSFAVELAKEHAREIRHIIIGLFISTYASAFVVESHYNHSPKLVDTIQNFSTSISTLLGAYQLAIWLLLDINAQTKQYLPHADKIDSLVFLIAIVLLGQLSIKQVSKEIIKISELFASKTTITVTPSSISSSSNVTNI